MGYETTFRLHGELDSKFKPWMTDVKRKDIEKRKQVLIAVCVLPFEGVKDSISLDRHYDKISFSFRTYVNYIREEWKFGIKERLDEESDYTKKGEIWFCGWNHADGRNTPWTEESLEEYFVRELFMDSIQDSGSPFSKDEKEVDSYYKKLEKISETVGDIEDCVYDMMDAAFIARYRNSEDADESDGYSHRFPEETDDDDDDDNITTTES